MYNNDLFPVAIFGVRPFQKRVQFAWPKMVVVSSHGKSYHSHGVSSKGDERSDQGRQG